jgi:biopolymer transport protein ExbD
MNRGRFAPKTPSLQLTSLLDMFTIILVFLLQSFQAEDENFTLHAGRELPTSDSQHELAAAVNIAVAVDGIYVEGEQVLPLVDGVAVDAETRGDEWPAITEAATDARDAVEGADPDVATVQADQGVPYDTVERAMRSVARAGCHRFRLVIAKE